MSAHGMVADAGFLTCVARMRHLDDLDSWDVDLLVQWNAPPDPLRNCILEPFIFWTKIAPINYQSGGLLRVR